jgi:Endodeoxyribonuclease RusA
MRIVIRGINPEPWSTGNVICYGKGRGTLSPNLKMLNYQNAIREELTDRIDSGGTPPVDVWAMDLHIYYFRSTERGHPADVTNLNKATEDALQGILFANDRINRKVTGEIIEQSPHVEYPGLIIVLRPYEFVPDEHEDLLAEMVHAPTRAFENVDYTPPTEEYFS